MQQTHIVAQSEELWESDPSAPGEEAWEADGAAIMALPAEFDDISNAATADALSAATSGPGTADGGNVFAAGDYDGDTDLAGNAASVSVGEVVANENEEENDIDNVSTRIGDDDGDGDGDGDSNADCDDDGVGVSKFKACGANSKAEAVLDMEALAKFWTFQGKQMARLVKTKKGKIVLMNCRDESNFWRRFC